MSRKLFGLAILLSACGAGDTSGGMPAEATVAKAVYEAKVREADSLKRVIDDLQNGPARQLAIASQALAKDERTVVRAAVTRILSRGEFLPEADSARKLISIVARRDTADAKEAIAARERALSGMVMKRDEMRNLTVWRDRNTPAYVNDRSAVAAYIIQPDQGQPVLRLAIYYLSDEWLFIREYHLKIDGEDFRFVPDSYGSEAVERDNDSGIWEWWDVRATGDRLRMLERLATAKSATIRYNGQQYYRDRTIGAGERGAIARTLLAFNTLSGAN